MKKVILFISLLFISASSVSNTENTIDHIDFDNVEYNCDSIDYNDIEYFKMDSILIETNNIVMSIQKTQNEIKILENKNQNKLNEIIYFTNKIYNTVKYE